MKKIETITDEQKAKMPEYVEKWISKGINTDRLDPVETKSIIDGFRNLIKMKTDVPLLIVNNPLEAWVACYLAKENFPIDKMVEEIADVFVNKNPKKYDIPKASLPWQSGSFFVSVFSFYDYMFNELGVKVDDELKAKYDVWEKTSEIGCIYPLENITIVSEKPTQVHLNERNVLHKDGGPALTYAGYGDIIIYALNGVVVPEYIAVTSEENLDINYYNQISNADVKAEFVRKVGIERFLDKGKLIDSYKNYDNKDREWWYKSEYEIWDMSFLFSNLEYAPYLKMVNQTTGIFHVEGISPQCRVVGDALKERFGDEYEIMNIA